VTCSLLWVRCLFDRFSISDFGGKWPLKWKFSFLIHRRDTEIRFVAKFRESRPLRSRRKVASITTQEKNSRSAGFVPAPYCPKWADRAQNFWNVVTPWHTRTPISVRMTYSGKIDFFGPKSQHNIRLQPTMTTALSALLMHHACWQGNPHVHLNLLLWLSCNV